MARNELKRCVSSRMLWPASTICSSLRRRSKMPSRPSPNAISLAVPSLISGAANSSRTISTLSSMRFLVALKVFSASSIALPRVAAAAAFKAPAIRLESAIRLASASAIRTAASASFSAPCVITAELRSERASVIAASMTPRKALCAPPTASSCFSRLANVSSRCFAALSRLSVMPAMFFRFSSSATTIFGSVPSARRSLSRDSAEAWVSLRDLSCCWRVCSVGAFSSVGPLAARLSLSSDSCIAVVSRGTSCSVSALFMLLSWPSSRLAPAAITTEVVAIAVKARNRLPRRPRRAFLAVSSLAFFERPRRPSLNGRAMIPPRLLSSFLRLRSIAIPG